MNITSRYYSGVENISILGEKIPFDSLEVQKQHVVECMGKKEEHRKGWENE